MIKKTYCVELERKIKELRDELSRESNKSLHCIMIKDNKSLTDSKNKIMNLREQISMKEQEYKAYCEN